MLRIGSRSLTLSLSLAVFALAACGDDDGTVAPAPIPSSQGGAAGAAGASAGKSGQSGSAGSSGGSGNAGAAGNAGASGSSGASCGGQPCLTFPFDAASPWPKFRGTAIQDGHSPIAFTKDMTGAYWEFQTGKGIFSSPVVSGDGVVYIGSADRTFYALQELDGTMKWSILTDEIIDSSALLDDEHRVYFGSGDGKLRAANRDDGTLTWTFQADDPSTTGGFINWFEGNVAIGPDGTLYVPNDNFRIYAIDRDTAEKRWAFDTPDQTWSLPAVDPVTGTLFVGNNNLLALLGQNTFSIDPTDGSKLWGAKVNGTIAASPLLTTNGLMVVGGFDGYLRSYQRDTGKPSWSFGARDHIYASASALTDGTIVLPAADGTAYGLHPDGSESWAFDTLEPLRSSPAVDGDGLIYFGSGEGRLFVLNSDGSLRWAMRLIDEDRSDLNSSPALGKSHILLGGENGKVFAVPYDYCLGTAGMADARCKIGPGEDLPSDGASLYFTNQFGKKLLTPPTTIEANQPLAFSLFVRKAGDTQLALIDATSLSVTVDPPIPLQVDVSGDRKFVTVIPTGLFTPDASGKVTVKLNGQCLVNPMRTGLKFSGGDPGGALSETFVFTINPTSAQPFPLPIPSQAGDPAGVWEIYRFAAPLPTILPSYNQIGFDSIHYLIGMMEPGPGGNGATALGWVVGAMLADGSNDTLVDPTTNVLFPVQINYSNGLVSFLNESGFTIEFNSVKIPFDLFRASTRVDATGVALQSPNVDVKTKCAGITLYGTFLEQLGFCNPETDLLNVWGASELRPWGMSGGITSAPSGVGTVTIAVQGTSVVATVTGSTLVQAQHAFGLALVDVTTGQPVTLDYGQNTTSKADSQGNLASVMLNLPTGTVLPTKLRAHLMVDTYPAITTVLGN